MKRTLAVLAILTLIVPTIAHAQTLNIRNVNTQALGQIVSRAIGSLTSAPYQNQYSAPQIRPRNTASAFSAAYQSGYNQGLAAARNAPQNRAFGASNGRWNQYNGFQRNVRGSWRGAY
jgi:hypothetical protein